VPTTTPPEFAGWNTNTNDGDSGPTRSRWHALTRESNEKNRTWDKTVQNTTENIHSGIYIYIHIHININASRRESRNTGKQTQDTQAGTCVLTTTPPEFAGWNSNTNDGDSEQTRLRWHALKRERNEKNRTWDKTVQNTTENIPSGIIQTYIYTCI